jgi:ABC-type amino acid transport substrate-binding protein
MKKSFRKLAVLLLSGVMAFSLTACGKSESSESKEPTAAASNSVAADGSVAGALKGVTLKVGTSGLFAPFSYYDNDGTTLIGFDLDFLSALQNLLGFEIDSNVQAMDYSALTTSVKEGKLDIGMAALCATDERKKAMNFSNTYYDSGQTVCINTETSPKEITGADVLKDGKYKVAVEKGTASHLYCINAGIPDSAIEVHDTITTAYASLEQGKVDCLIQDTPGMAYYIKATEGTKLSMVGDEFNQGQAPYAIAISFDCSDANSGIVDTFNKAIEELTANGTMDQLKAKWCE